MQMTWIQGKKKWLLLLCTALTFGTGMTAFAQGSIKVGVENQSKSNWTVEVQEPSVTVNSSEGNPEWSKSVDNWEPGKKVYGTIRISGTYSSSDCSVSGGDLVSVKNDDDETVIKFSYVPVAKLGTTEKAGWADATKTKASWKKVPFASRYQVVLYNQNGVWLKSLTTSSTTVDLLSYMENGSTYYYTVKAILKDTSEDAYLSEGEMVISEDSVVQELGDVAGTWAEYQDGKKYRIDDGDYVVSSWRMISGKWYYFGSDGYAVTGWQYLGDKWYYMSSDAQMTTGWQEVDGKWYYLNEDGDMATGWVQAQPGKWYYLNSDGSMAANTVVDGGYSVDSTGLWIH